MRLSNSGTFIHGNYWGAKSIFGAVNTSHGCVGLSDTKGAGNPDAPAAWFYDHSLIGDVVVVKNTGDKTIAPDNGLNGWNLSWFRLEGRLGRLIAPQSLVRRWRRWPSRVAAAIGVTTAFRDRPQVNFRAATAFSSFSYAGLIAPSRTVPFAFRHVLHLPEARTAPPAEAALVVASGLALGIALVIVVSSVSSGMEKAPGQGPPVAVRTGYGHRP